MATSTPTGQYTTILLNREIYEALRFQSYKSRKSMAKLINESLARDYLPTKKEDHQQQQTEQE